MHFKRTALISIIALTGLAVTASAIPLDAYYLGKVEDGTPASESLEAYRLNQLIAAYNDGVSGPPETFSSKDPSNQNDWGSAKTGQTQNYTLDPGASVPSAPLALIAYGDWYKPGDASGSTFTLLTGYEWIAAKWGRSVTTYYYVGGLSGEVTLSNPNGRQGLSHITYFGAVSVPDGASTLVLLGLGLVALAGVRARASRN